MTGVLLLALSATDSRAADVSMTTSDTFGQSSFNTAGHWDSLAAPTAGNNYFTRNFIVRSPNSGTNFYSFAGDALILSPQGALYAKLAPLTLMVNNLTNMGRVVNAQGGVFTVVGNMYVPADNVGGGMDTGSGNSSATDSRTISNAMTIAGSGALTNYTSETAGSPQYWQTARGTVIHTGNNINFTGPQVIIKNTAVVVSSQANLGGNPAVFNPAQLEFNIGILRPAASFSLDNANSGITIDAGGGAFDIASGLTLTNENPLAGAGTLSFTNSGTFVQKGSAASYTGTLAINNGTFVLDTVGSLAGQNTISVGSAATFDATAAGIALASGQTLAGSGTVLGTVTAGTDSKISPAGTGVAANLAIGNLTLTGGASLVCDFLATNDVVVVNGNLSPSGVTKLQLVNVPANGTYTLVTVAGTLGGTAANFQTAALTTRTKQYSISYDTASTPKRVLLTVTGSGAAANLVWQGDTVNGLNNAWDITTSLNWLNSTTSDVYYDADTVNFTDAGATNQPTLDIVVNPAAVNFNSSSNYTLTSPSGAGNIAGSTGLYKGGTGTATVSVTNTYSGGTIITNGVLQLGAAMALGSPSGSTPLATISGTGSLDLNGAPLDALYTSAVRINGHGFSATQGAINNTVGGLTSGGGDVGIGTLVLTGDSTVTANQNWQVGNTGQGIVGNGYNLTVRVTSGYSLFNYVYLKRAAASALGTLVIDGSGVLFWDRPDAAGPVTPLVLTNGGTIDTWNPVNYFDGLTFANPIVVNDPVNGGRIVSIRSPGWTHPDYDTYNGSVTLNGSLTISNASWSGTTPETFGRVTMNGNLTGPGGLNVFGGTDHPVIPPSGFAYGGNLVTLNGLNSYTGPTVVSNLVQLRINTGNQSGGAYTVVDNGMLDVVVAPGKPTIPMSSLTATVVNYGGGNIGFTRLSQMPTSPVIYATNLNITAGVIQPPMAGYSVGQFPLIKYDTISGSGFAGLQLATPPAGVTASLVDNTINKTIDLKVDTAGFVWKGNISSDWDILTTMNWINPATATADLYSDGQAVVFDDSASTFTVNLTTTVQPGGVTFNAANNYYITNVSGGIGGSAALVKNGAGTLTVACTNNTFSGGTYINQGTLKLSDRDYAYPYGAGNLNNNLGLVRVNNGATLDINAVQVPNYQQFGPAGYDVFISGSGADGSGALVNNNTNNADNACPGHLTLMGNATVGGAGDINIRHGGLPLLTSQSSDFTLTKVGTGQFRIRYVTSVSTNFGAVNVLQGIVSYESSSTLGFGDPTKPVTIASGAGFAWGTATVPCNRPLICSNGAALYARNTVSNVFTGPVTIDSGNVDLNANYFNGMTFSNAISGAGGISVLYNSTVTLAASNSYAGNTTVWRCNANPGSVLRLTGNGSINQSPAITLQGIQTGQTNAAGLDVSGRTDGTLTLLSGQTLRGDNGSYVRGNVIAGSGATITPGGSGNIQYMTASNNLTLQAGSTVAMDVSLDGGLTNDLITVRGTASYGGTLQINNSGATALTNGASFKLFNAATVANNFSSIVGSPGPNLGWTFTPSTGIAKVVYTGATNPTNISYSVVGNQLTLTWPADHLGWILQTQTNTLAVGVSTNWVTVPGSGSSTQAVITIDPSNPTAFFRLRSP